MKTAICYLSVHHGNTLQLLQAMAQAENMDLIDLRTRQTVDLTGYDRVGFASGIYGFAMHQAVLDFARQYLPAGKPVFFVYTYGLTKGTGAGELKKLAAERGCPVLGEFGCRGYDTFGPFRLVGGLSKGHPDQQDLEQGQAFIRRLAKA